MYTPRITVQVLEKTNLDRKDRDIWINVLGTGIDKSGKFLISKAAGIARVEEKFPIDRYFIRSISVTPREGVQGETKSWLFSTGAEKQNEAVETVEQLLETLADASVEEEEEEEQMIAIESSQAKILGPKRIEVELQDKETKSTIKIVALDSLPPKGVFQYHTLQARYWIGKELSSEVRFFNSSSHILRTITYHKGGVSAYNTFLPSQDINGQIGGWKRIHTFMKKLETSELNVIKGWGPSSDSADSLEERPGIYGSAYPLAPGSNSNYYSKTPSYYSSRAEDLQPSFRVMGDEEGITAFEKQQEKMKKSGFKIKSLEEIDQDAREKKREAGGDEEQGTPSASQAHGHSSVAGVSRNLEEEGSDWGAEGIENMLGYAGHY